MNNTRKIKVSFQPLSPWQVSAWEGVIQMSTMYTIKAITSQPIKPHVMFNNINGESFYRSWVEKLHKLAHAAKTYAYSREIEIWAEMIEAHNIANEKKLFDERLATLRTINAYITLGEILEKYDQMFEIMLSRCNVFPAFQTALTFINELPGEVLKAIERISARQECGAEIVQTQKITKQNLKQEPQYTVMNKDVGECQHLLFFRRDYSG